jgi:hypothetical protein
MVGIAEGADIIVLAVAVPVVYGDMPGLFSHAAVGMASGLCVHAVFTGCVSASAAVARMFQVRVADFINHEF